MGDSNNKSVTFFRETLEYTSCIDYIIASYDLTCYVSTANIANKCPSIAKDHCRVDGCIWLPITAEFDSDVVLVSKEKIKWPKDISPEYTTYKKELSNCSNLSNILSINEANNFITNNISAASWKAFTYKQVLNNK